MIAKKFELANVGSVMIIKRQSSRHLKLSISPQGEVRVSIPKWVPYQVGLDFANSKRLWIEQKRPKLTPLIDNQPVGRAHRLKFHQDHNEQRIKTRINGNNITITFPDRLNYDHPSVQWAARLAAVRALRRQAVSLLPQRLDALSNAHSLTYTDVQVKRMSSRWGSCDQEKRIVLNLYLIQLPWELIDYVILHELTHTLHLNHGAAFWASLETFLPQAKQQKKIISQYRPGILTV